MEKNQDNWSSTIVYLLAWLICSIMMIVDVLMIRQASLVVLRNMQANRVAQSAPGDKTATQMDTGYLIQTIDQGILFGGGIVAVALSIGVEYYFRMGQKHGKLLKRIGKVLAIQAAVFVVSVLIQTFG